MKSLSRTTLRGEFPNRLKSDFLSITVLVALDGNGKPSFEIREPVAGDYIPLSGNPETVAHKMDAVCFGSLAQRNRVSRQSIRTFVRAMPKDALKIFDVNLRQHFSTKEIIEESLLHLFVRQSHSRAS